jgi:hypothetical protein
MKPVGSARRSSVAPKLEQLEERTLLSLLGVSLEYPQVTYDVLGTLAYNATAETFDSQAVPTAFRLSSTSPPVVVRAPRNFQLHFLVDNSGNVIGGVPGDDLLIEGQIDVNRDNIIDYDGVLLTAEIRQFGYLDTGTVTDQYDFRLIPTGGDLLPFFAGQDVGMRMTSPNSTFGGSFTVNFLGEAHGILGPIDILSAGSVAGRVFVDANNNGADDTEAGIQDATIAVSGTDYRGTAVSQSLVTAPDGSYLFDNLLPGSYALSEVHPSGYLDGNDASGSLGGLAGDDVITGIVLGSGQHGAGYTFGELLPSSLSGFAWVDFNDDGEIDFNEKAIEGVGVSLTGLDDRGNAVSLTAQTDIDGIYAFEGLRPGQYTLTETQPGGFQDGKDKLGSIGGIPGNDVFQSIPVGVGVDGINYNFGERVEAGATLTSGQTATIGFWQNKNGQNLIKSLNGGESGTQLGNWLAATYPNLYADLAGKTNAEVAGHYQELFRAKKSVAGPAKVDCQVMGTAFAVYVTNSSLAGTAAASYGFLVTDYGVGIATWNVGTSGAAFGVANDSIVTVMDLLLATDSLSSDGKLYNFDALLRTLANAVYSAINEAGDIG